GRAAPCLIVKGRKVVGQFSTEFVDAGHDQFPVGAVFQTCVFADLLVVLVTGKVHAKDRVVVVGAGKFGGGIGDQHLDQLFDVNPTLADNLYANSLRDVSILDDRSIFFWHGIFLSS